ncbi:hypothetical protein AOLI_G00011950 [Acnodon oligacanthus]
MRRRAAQQRNARGCDAEERLQSSGVKMCDATQSVLRHLVKFPLLPLLAQYSSAQELLRSFTAVAEDSPHSFSHDYLDGPCLVDVRRTEARKLMERQGRSTRGID